MAIKRFFQRKGPFSLEEIARLSDCRIVNFKGDASQKKLHDFSLLDEAGPDDVNFMINRKYIDTLRQSKAAACFISEEMVQYIPADMVALVSRNPHKAYAIAASIFYPKVKKEAKIDSTAIIHPSAKIGKNCFVGPYVVIEQEATIGEHTILDAHVYIGEKVVLGENCHIHPHVTISHAIIGDKVTVYPGSRIGQSGFGYAMDQYGHKPVPQLGQVVIGHHVEIGSNTTIDRGSLRDTVIGDECVIDNLVQIAHNVKLGRGCVIVSQTGISGSTTLEDYVVTAGQVGLAGHLRIGAGTKLGGQSGVMSDIPSGQEYMGSPAVPVRQFFKQTAALKRLIKQTKKEE